MTVRESRAAKIVEGSAVKARKDVEPEGDAAPRKAPLNPGTAVTRVSATPQGSVLEAVARRLEEEPQRVLPTLQLLADLDATPEPDDADTVALARTVNARRQETRLAEFRARAYSTAQVRDLLGGLTRQAVALRASTGKLLAYDVAGRNYFPDWQFGDQGPLPGLARVLEALGAGGRSALAADALMRTPLPEEGGRSPADLLSAGEVDRAVHYVDVAGGGF